MCRSTKLLILLAIVASLAAPALATSWDVANDFSTATNPSGAWSFGHKMDYTYSDVFTVYSQGTPVLHDHWGGNYAGNFWWTQLTGDWWCDAGSPPGAPHRYGGVAKNISGAPINGTLEANVGNFPSSYIEAGQVFVLSPCWDNNYKAKSFVRWTAPNDIAALSLHAVMTNQSNASPNPGVNAQVRFRGAAVGMANLRGFVGTAAAGYADSTPGVANTLAVDAVLYNVKSGDIIDFRADREILGGSIDNKTCPIGLVAQLNDSPSLGTVSGSAPTGTKVSAVGTNQSAVASAGAYSMNLAPGTYTLRATKQGYAPVTQSSVVVTASNTTTVNITLGSANAYWDVSDNWDVSANPNGVWSYGYKATSNDTGFSSLGYPFTAQADIPIDYRSQALLNDTGNGNNWDHVAASLYHNSLPWAGGDYRIRPLWSGGIWLEPYQNLGVCGTWASNIYYRAVYRWKPPVAGTFRVLAKFSGPETGGGTGATVEVMKNTSLIGGGQIFGFAGRSLYGYTDSTGTPTVVVDSLVTVATSDTIDFQVGNQRFAAVQATITVPPPPGYISGYVRSTYPGSPIVAGASITVVAGGSGSTTSDSTGYFSLPLGAGTYSIKATAGGYLDQTDTGIVVTSSNTTNHDITMTGLGRITGVVRSSASGNPPIAGAAVTLTPGSTVVTGADGTYLFTGLTAGSYTVSVSRVGCASQTAGVTATNSTITTQNFTLSQVSKSQAFPYDLSGDFDYNHNPNGAWTYGYKSGATGTFTANAETQAPPETPGVGYWGTGVNNPYPDDMRWTSGMIYRNDNATPVQYPQSVTRGIDQVFIGWGTGGNMWLDPGQCVQFVSQFGGGPNNRAVARWTAPSTGNVQVNATFKGVIIGGGGGIPEIVKNNSTVIAAPR